MPTAGSVSTQDATPLALVVPLQLWLPSANVIVAAATGTEGLADESTSVAVSVMALPAAPVDGIELRLR